MKSRAFFFHFNKPESAKRGQVTLTLHYRGACYLVSNIICQVPTRGRVRNNQPRFVMTGRATDITIDAQGVATIA